MCRRVAFEKANGIVSQMPGLVHEVPSSILDRSLKKEHTTFSQQFLETADTYAVSAVVV